MTDCTPRHDAHATTVELPAPVRDRLAAIARNAQAALDGDLPALATVEAVRRLASDCRGLLVEAR